MQTGMPQLNVTTFGTQLFWLVVTFSLLYFVMMKYFLPRVSSVLQARKDRISGDLDKAEEFRREASSLQGEYEQSLKEMRAKTSALITQAQEKAKQKAEESHKNLDEELTQKLKKAESDIEKARKQAEEKISSISSELSRDIVRKLTGVDVDEKEAVSSVKTLLKGNG